MENNRASANQSATTTREELLPPLLRAIEMCLQFPYRRMRSERGEWYWMWRSNVANFTARIYPDVSRGAITIAVFDEETGVAIKKWSGELRLTGKWRRRLRRSAGEALALAQRRLTCPNVQCRGPLVLKERNDGSCQFFGCRNHPACKGSASICDHDIERNYAAGTAVLAGE